MITRVTKIDTQIEPFAIPFRKDRRLNMALASQAACPFFEKLAPELRNQICEYVFTPGKSRHKALVTATFKLPESNFLLPCQRVFVEANGIFEVARTAYWKRSTFYVDLLSKGMNTWPSSCEIVDNLHKRELKLIRKMLITSDRGKVLRKWHLTTRRGSMKGWIATDPPGDQMKELSFSGKRKGLYEILGILS